VLLLLSLYQLCTGASIPRGYSKSDKDAALEALALAMLLVRDKRPQIEALLRAEGSCGGSGGGSSSGGDSGSSSSDGGAGGGSASPNNVTYTAESPRPNQTVSHTTASTTPNTTNTSSNPSLSPEVLFGLVDQLAALACAAEHNQQLYHQTHIESVYVDWGNLSKKLGVGSGKSDSVSRPVSSSGGVGGVCDVSEVNSANDASGSVAKTQDSTSTTPTAITTNSKAHSVHSERGDSDDDLEMATISELHKRKTHQ